MKKFLIIMAGLMFAITSCTEKPDIWDSSTVECAGDWFIQFYAADGTLVESYKKIFTYNTAADNGDMWINFRNAGTTNVVTKVTTSGSTFSGSDVLTVSNGQVISGGGLSRTGVKTDSIYMQVDVSGVSYSVAGHRVTGFVEDNY